MNERDYEIYRTQLASYRDWHPEMVALMLYIHRPKALITPRKTDGIEWFLVDQEKSLTTEELVDHYPAGTKIWAEHLPGWTDIEDISELCF